MMEGDKIIKCKHCGEEMCYEYPHPKFTQWLCFGCGYGYTSYMTVGSDFVEQNRISLPELVKDLEFIDEDNFVWYPNSMSLPEKGILFPNGSGKDAWGWTVAPLVEILEEEKFRFPANQKYKIDITRMEHFDKQDYAQAVSFMRTL